MATPQRSNPNDPLQDLSTNQTQDIVDRGGTRRSLWLWVVIAAVIVAIIWVAWWGWTYVGGGHGTGASSAAAVASTKGQGEGLANQGPAGQVGPGAPAGSGVPALNAQDKRAFIGRAFEVRNVPVQEQTSNGVVWIGGDATTPTLVVLARSGNSAASTIGARGNLVDVTGTVTKAPSEAEARHSWGLSSSSAKQLEREGAYVKATQLETAAK